MPPTQDQFGQSLKDAVALEREADVLLTNEYLTKLPAKRLAKLGLAVVNLLVDAVRTGLGGKTLLDLVPDSATGGELVAGSIRLGDIVRIQRMGKAEEDQSLDAVVTKVSSLLVTISIDQDSGDDKVLSLYNNTGQELSRMWIVKLASSSVYNRMISSLNKLQELGENHDNEIVKLLLGQMQYMPRQSSQTIKATDFYDDQLNPSQRNAVDFLVNKLPISIIHGPPGTGKTYTLIEIIKQLTFKHKERVLVCGPSNISVDTILERLSPVFSESAPNGYGKKRAIRSKAPLPSQLIRIGHPARLLPLNLLHSLDVLTKGRFSGDSSDDDKAILRELQVEISSVLSKAKKCKRYSERRALWADLKDLKRDLRIREKRVVENLLLGSKVVLATLHGLGSYELTSLAKDHPQPLFDTLIIDEVSQLLEPQCWIPLINHLGIKRLVIAGDNMQLPPTIKAKDLPRSTQISISKDAYDLELTLFDRLVAMHGKQYTKLLDTQYRLNESIMKFASEQLYGGELKAHESVQDITLSQLDYVEHNADTEAVCIWYDTQGGDFPEQVAEKSDSSLAILAESKYNESEVLVVLQHVRRLLSCGVQPQDIGIISPYNAQVALLKKTLMSQDGMDGIEISSVDGFQGREKTVIVLSLVRSNDDHQVGFLKDRRRLNVATTRPQRQLVVVGDFETMSRSGVPYLEKWCLYVEDARHNWEIVYPDLGDF